MAAFEDHIAQAKRNLTCLSSINRSVSDSMDWQISIAFYTAVHLVNAHLAVVSDLHPVTHEDRKLQINPNGSFINTRFPPDEFARYVALEGLSKRARYLCSEGNRNELKAHWVYEVHLAKALRHLNSIILFVSKTHKVRFKKIDCVCSELKTGEKLEAINILSPVR